MKTTKKALPAKDSKKLIEVLRGRFEKNMHRHKGFKWERVQEKLESQSGKLWSVYQMEQTGGEPDVIGYDKKVGEFDTKTSSWIVTPPEIRKLGGAIFADRRYDTFFACAIGLRTFV
ncbi:MAG: DUF4256 domain-containing protein [bacterium]